jgi:hypothetical protein
MLGINSLRELHSYIWYLVWKIRELSGKTGTERLNELLIYVNDVDLLVGSSTAIFSYGNICTIFSPPFLPDLASGNGVLSAQWTIT